MSETGDRKFLSIESPRIRFMEPPEQIRENLMRVHERIEKAASAAGRTATEIALLAVTKTIDPARILAAYQAGQRLFGENRVQEAEEKLGSLRQTTPDAKWVMIGHLQSNKAGKAVSLFDQIHSIDSVKLADEISARSQKVGQEIGVLIEINSSGEESKFGVKPDLAMELMAHTAELPGLDLNGVMTIGPNTQDTEEISRAFAQTRRILEKARIKLGKPLPILSMGMSSDFEIAIAEGSSLVRLGTSIFGERER